jgi:predicted DNA-binding protein
MAKKIKKKGREGSALERVSVGFPPELHNTIELIAKQKKVSFAWVVREAAEKYVEAQWPLLAQNG